MGRLLLDPRGGSFRFDAGAVCLDFAHTGGEGEYAIFETLHKPADLAAWLAQPPLDAAVMAPIADDELRHAKALRQAIWEAAQARARGDPLPCDAVGKINAAAERPPLVPRIDPAGARAAWAPPVEVSQVLSTLAREAIDVLTGPLAARVRTCASDDCPLVFVDSSRPNARRWCAMERCGNRQKVRALRKRRREDPSSDLA
jgi:predicted RNA-binding Zn ribbon-like protein